MPIRRSLGKLVDDSRSTEYCSGPLYLYCSCPIPVPDKFQDPAKLTISRSSQADNSKIQPSSSQSGSRSRGLADSSGSWRLINASRTVTRVPIVNLSPVKTIRFPVRISVLRGSAVCHLPRSPDPVKAIQFPSRFRSCQGLPVQFLSSSRIHDESDHIDPTHQSSSSQGSVLSSSNSRIPVRTRSSHTSPIPSIRLTSPVPVQSLSKSRSCQAQGPVPVPIPGSRIHPCSVHNNKFCSEVRAGSPQTFPDDLP